MEKKFRPLGLVNKTEKEGGEKFRFLREGGEQREGKRN